MYVRMLVYVHTHRCMYKQTLVVVGVAYLQTGFSSPKSLFVAQLSPAYHFPSALPARSLRAGIEVV